MEASNTLDPLDTARNDPGERHRSLQELTSAATETWAGVFALEPGVFPDYLAARLEGIVAATTRPDMPALTRATR
jgi:hypothetical protein